MSSQESVCSDYQGGMGFSSANGRSQSPTLANARSHTLANVRSFRHPFRLPPANCVLPCLLPPPKKWTSSSAVLGYRPRPPLFLLSGLLRFSLTATCAIGCAPTWLPPPTQLPAMVVIASARGTVPRRRLVKRRTCYSPDLVSPQGVGKWRDATLLLLHVFILP
jgi:hypothetical protein